MQPGTAYYRTRQHVVPAGVPEGGRIEDRGWGQVCVNMRAMRQATAQVHWEVFGLERRKTGFSRVELLTFQMALGIAGEEQLESARFHDLVATGFVRTEEREAVMKAWCEGGAIPQSFTPAGRGACH